MENYPKAHESLYKYKCTQANREQCTETYFRSYQCHQIFNLYIYMALRNTILHQGIAYRKWVWILMVHFISRKCVIDWVRRLTDLIDFDGGRSGLFSLSQPTVISSRPNPSHLVKYKGIKVTEVWYTHNCHTHKD